MYVDGASHQALVADVNVKPAHREPAPASESPLLARRDGLYLPNTSHPAHILRDTFQRLQAAAAEDGGYSKSDGAKERPAAIAVVFEELRTSLGEGYHAAISELESAYAAGGVPAGAEPEASGAVYHAFLEAYERVSVNHADPGYPEQHNLLDTLS